MELWKKCTIGLLQYVRIWLFTLFHSTRRSNIYPGTGWKRIFSWRNCIIKSRPFLQNIFLCHMNTFIISCRVARSHLRPR